MLGFLFSFLLIFQTASCMTDAKKQEIATTGSVDSKEAGTSTKTVAQESLFDVLEEVGRLARDPKVLQGIGASDPLEVERISDESQVKRVSDVLKNHDKKTVNIKEKGWPIIAWAVYQCCCVGVIRVLLEKEAEVNATLDDETGSTALHYAVGCGFTEVVKVLVLHDADVEARNKAGQTPIEAGKIEAEEKRNRGQEGWNLCKKILNIIKVTIPEALKERDKK